MADQMRQAFEELRRSPSSRASRSSSCSRICTGATPRSSASSTRRCASPSTTALRRRDRAARDVHERFPRLWERSATRRRSSLAELSRAVRGAARARGAPDDRGRARRDRSSSARRATRSSSRSSCAPRPRAAGRTTPGTVLAMVTSRLEQPRSGAAPYAARGERVRPRDVARRARVARATPDARRSRSTCRDARGSARSSCACRTRDSRATRSTSSATRSCARPRTACSPTPIARSPTRRRESGSSRGRSATASCSPSTSTRAGKTKRAIEQYLRATQQALDSSDARRSVRPRRARHRARRRVGDVRRAAKQSSRDRARARSARARPRSLGELALADLEPRSARGAKRRLRRHRLAVSRRFRLADSLCRGDASRPAHVPTGRTSASRSVRAIRRDELANALAEKGAAVQTPAERCRLHEYDRCATRSRAIPRQRWRRASSRSRRRARPTTFASCAIADEPRRHAEGARRVRAGLGAAEGSDPIAERIGYDHMANVARHNLGLTRAREGSVEEGLAIERDAARDLQRQGTTHGRHVERLPRDHPPRRAVISRAPRSTRARRWTPCTRSFRCVTWPVRSSRASSPRTVARRKLFRRARRGRVPRRRRPRRRRRVAHSSRVRGDARRDRRSFGARRDRRRAPLLARASVAHRRSRLPPRLPPAHPRARAHDRALRVGFESRLTVVFGHASSFVTP